MNDLDFETEHIDLIGELVGSLRRTAEGVPVRSLSMPRARARWKGSVAAISIAAAAVAVFAVALPRRAPDSEVPASGVDRYHLPEYVPAGMRRTETSGPAKSVASGIWTRVYSGRGLLVRVETQAAAAPTGTRGATGSQSVLDVARVDGGTSVTVDSSCGLVFVEVSGVDRNAALEIAGTLRCTPAGTLMAGEVVVDAPLVFEGDHHDLFGDRYFEASWDNGAGAGFTLDSRSVDPTFRWPLMMSGVALRNRLSTRDYKVVTFPNGNVLVSWKEANAFLSVNSEGIDEATAIKIADSVREVTKESFFNAPATPSSLQTSTTTARREGFLDLDTIAVASVGDAMATYGTYSSTRCLQVERGSHGAQTCGQSSPALDGLPVIVLGLNNTTYLATALSPDVVDVTLTVADGSRHRLAKAEARSADPTEVVFFGAFESPINSFGKPNAQALVTRRNGMVDRYSVYGGSEPGS